MLSLNALAMIFLTPLSTVIGTLRQLQWVRAYFERLIDVLEAKPEDIGATASRMKPLAGCIELKNVSFQYSFESPLVLKDISLTIESGQKVALVGRSGSGKSTLALLLLGLYKPTTGAIYYDGQSLSKLDYRWLRRQFGVVLQDPFLFSHSIRQNITFNNPALPLARVQEAAQLAIIDEDIQQLPLGYETPVTEGGLGFSGGQRQRLCIARALAKDPSILLLDEATSHLDVETERKVYGNLDTLTCTRIVIAHRLSTITNADLIIVLDSGRIIEKGTHHELLAKGQAYACLIHNQLEADNHMAYGN
jgi:ATP-binding cassette, subfamily B, bacterial